MCAKFQDHPWQPTKHLYEAIKKSARQSDSAQLGLGVSWPIIEHFCGTCRHWWFHSVYHKHKIICNNQSIHTKPRQCLGTVGIGCWLAHRLDEMLRPHGMFPEMVAWLNSFWNQFQTSYSNSFNSCAAISGVRQHQKVQCACLSWRGVGVVCSIPKFASVVTAQLLLATLALW